MPAEGASQPQRGGFTALVSHASENKISMTMWCTRLVTMLFSFLYFLPFGFWNPVNMYYKALLANAATSALRVHQRLSPIAPTAINMGLLSKLMFEDSFHYLMYSITFLYVPPISLAVIPIFLFALLHFASYSLTLLDIEGQNSWWALRLMINLVEFQQFRILNFIACMELVLFPSTILMFIMGRLNPLTLFMYYQFLKMRCKSQRNHFTKNALKSFLTTLNTTARSTSTSPLYSILKFISEKLLMILLYIVPQEAIPGQGEQSTQ